MEQEYAYVIRKCNPFDNELVGETVALFMEQKLAVDFVEYQASIGNTYAIFHRGKRIALD